MLYQYLLYTYMIFLLFYKLIIFGDWKNLWKTAFHFLNSFNWIISYNTQFYGTNFTESYPQPRGLDSASASLRLHSTPARVGRLKKKLCKNIKLCINIRKILSFRKCVKLDKPITDMFLYSKRFTYWIYYIC